MHTIKLILTYYLNISVQAANLSDCRIESNRKKIDSVARIESKRIETFLPELECSNIQYIHARQAYGRSVIDTEMVVSSAERLVSPYTNTRYSRDYIISGFRANVQ